MSDPIPASVFQAVANTLSIGQRGRMEHDCGEGGALLISKDSKGSRAFCFRCSRKGYIPATLSLADRIAQLNAGKEDEQAQKDATAPGPREFDPQKWPVHARLWLYRSGFSNDDIERFGWYWNARLRRVILPVGEAFWQGRGFGDQVKYINPEVDRSRVVAKYGTPGPVLVLTEDILSAAKVSKAGAWAWSCLGVRLPLPVALEIEKLKVPVIVGLDPDKAGYQGASRIARELRLLGVDAVPSFMTTDPKNGSLERIQEWIRDTCLRQSWPLAPPA